MPSMSQPTSPSLLDRIGGRRSLYAVVENLYEKVLEDDRLIEFFAGCDIDDLIDHQKRFLSFVMTDFPPDFDVYDLITRRHARFFERGLSEKHYDLMIYYLVQTLKECRVKMDVITDVVASVKPYRKAFEDGAKRYGAGAQNRDRADLLVSASHC